MCKDRNSIYLANTDKFETSALCGAEPPRMADTHDLKGEERRLQVAGRNGRQS